MNRLLALVIFHLCIITAAAAQSAEIRAIWIATNSGLDWPKNAKSPESQKKSLTDMLDKLVKANFNTVVFQVQSHGDVAWKSKKQPAMAAITGNHAKGLDYDVARFVIDECHKRGLECHAWVVPFRVGTAKAASLYRKNKVKHIVTSHPEYCVRHAGSYYIDPGLPEARKYLIDLYSELVENYDFDGINLDYTRYPGLDFNDSQSFKKHNKHNMKRDDWRRDNINTFVADLYKRVKKLRPDMKVGSAPIGTYRNPPGLKNATGYDNFCQDAMQWASSGHHDMLIPQLYWTEKFGFSRVMKSWADSNPAHCSLVIGLAPYKLIDEKWQVDIIIDQINKARSTDGVAGVCFFRADHVLGTHKKSRELYRRLSTELFAKPAILPTRDAKSQKESKKRHKSQRAIVQHDFLQ